ncbi:MAG: fasciclin domain-containing protein, partial [Myxococcota bacterium]
PGRLTAADIRQRSGAETLSGQRLDFRARGRSLKIDGARIVKSDISADNGIIHVIDQVLKPSTHDLVTLAREAGKFSTLLAALDAAALSEVLRGGGPFTVFAPTDKAFSRLGPDTVTALLRPENRDQLIAVLKNHVVSGRVYAEQAASAGAVHTLAGTGLRFAVNSGRLQVNGVRLLDTDRDADNGVIHVVDRVLVPML